MRPLSQSAPRKRLILWSGSPSGDAGSQKSATQKIRELLVDSYRLIYRTSKDAVSLVTATRVLGRGPRSLSEAEYPAEIRPLKPSMVAIGEHGVYVYIRSSPLRATGIFIRQDPKFIPPAPKPDSDEWGYEPVGADIFWFSRPR